MPTPEVTSPINRFYRSKFRSQFTKLLRTGLTTPVLIEKFFFPLLESFSDFELVTRTVMKLFAPAEADAVLAYMQNHKFRLSGIPTALERQNAVEGAIKIERRLTTETIYHAAVEILLSASDGHNDDAATLTYLQQLMGLSEYETDILFLAYIVYNVAELDFLTTSHDMRITAVDKVHLISGIARGDIVRALSPTGKLIATGLISDRSNDYEPGEAIRDLFDERITLAEFEALNFNVTVEKPFTPDSFDFPRIDRDIIVSLLAAETPVNILFYGKPGTGKTELARSLVHASGRRALLVANKKNDEDRERIQKLRFSTYFSENAVLIVDEADEILNTRTWSHTGFDDSAFTKSQLNDFLDESKAKIIWITNETASVHESTLRRFAYRKKFEKLSRAQRARALGVIVGKYSAEALLSDEVRAQLLAEEQITPGILDITLRSAMTVCERSVADFSAVVKTLIANHLVGRDGGSNKMGAIDESYDIAALNTGGNHALLLNATRQFYAEPVRRGKGMNILLHGAPGSGKTEFVKYIASTVGRDILFKRGSDLLDMYVGQTEKLIAAAFGEAQAREAILLIDEADTFFVARERAERNWEISHTNEFLNQMENHSCLVFCCTNFIAHLDRASLRRFHFKLEFLPLDHQKAAALFRSYFDDFVKTLPGDLEIAGALNRVGNLTPGDFRAVRQRLQFCERASLPWMEIVDELTNEVRYKTDGRRIRGFGA